MSGELKTVMGQLNIAGGRLIGEPPNTLAVREPAGSRRKGDLFVVIELRGCDPQSPAGQQLSQALARTIRNVYYQAPTSITASLQHALAAANTQLRQPAGGAASGVFAGVAALVVRGEDVFIATLGPAVTYIAAAGGVAQFPETSPWLGAAGLPAADAPALGRWDDVDAQLFHVPVKPGDMLVLGDSRFAGWIAPDKIEKAVAYQSVEDALANLIQLVNRRDCTALVIEVQASAPSAGRLIHGHHGLHPLEAASFPSPAALLSGRQLPRLLPRHLPDIHISLPVGRWLRALARGWVVLLMASWAGLGILFSRMLPGHEAQVRQATARRPVRLPISQNAFRTVAFAIPLIVLIVVSVTYWQRGVAWEDEFRTRLAQAQAAYDQAASADDKTARGLLDQADHLLAEAEVMQPNEPAIPELHRSIAERRDKVDRIERLYWVGQLRTYDEPFTQLRRVVHQGLDLYVLDAGGDQVYRHQLDDVGENLRPNTEDFVLVRRAQQVAARVVGEIIDVAWLPADGGRLSGRLLILERDGLLEYGSGSDLSAVPIAGVDGWRLPIAATGYSGNLYVLDPEAGQIFRYLPGPSGYPDPPQLYFSGQSGDVLSGAIDMAIDGFIYVLYANGGVRKFAGGVPVMFDITDLDRPLTDPTAIYTAPDPVARYVYIADPGNQRVLQLTKEGHFVRQIRPRPEDSASFSALKSIFVDESAGKLYWLNATSLYIANLSPVP